MAIPTSYEQVTYNSPDGAQVGKDENEKIGFFGKTPIARPTVTWRNTTTATTSTNKLRINRIYAALINLGLIVTS